MTHLVTFFEGVFAFLSPCMLPMLPLYLTYFAGQAADEAQKRRRTLVSALGFFVGFSIVFVLLGAFAGTLGRFLSAHSRAVEIMGGIIVMLLGLSYWELPALRRLRLPTLHRAAPRLTGFFSAVLFGTVFAASWMPCVGAFLGSALLLAAQGNMLFGMSLLLSFSLGLGLPLLLSALLLSRAQAAFDVLKRHMGKIRAASGALLMLMGLAMALGYLSRLTQLWT